MDLREKLLTDLNKELMFLSFEDREKVISKSTILLNNYILTKNSNEVSIRRDDSFQLIDLYLNCKRVDGLSESSIETYGVLLRNLYFVIGKPFNQITAMDIRSYIAKKSLKHKKTYLNCIIVCTRDFFNFLYREDIINESPVENIKKIKIASKFDEPPFNSIELDKIRNSCKDCRDSAIVEVMLSTGMRLNEVISLKLNDIDLENNEVRVINGKGGKDRLVYLTDLAAYKLKAYLVSRKDNCEYAFISKRAPYLKMNKGGMHKFMKSLTERSGVNHIHAHRFRHTYATRLLNSGVSIDEVCKLMGHESINTTMHYIHKHDAQLKASFIKHYN